MERESHVVIWKVQRLFWMHLIQRTSIWLFWSFFTNLSSPESKNARRCDLNERNYVFTNKRLPFGMLYLSPELQTSLCSLSNLPSPNQYQHSHFFSPSIKSHTRLSMECQLGARCDLTILDPFDETISYSARNHEFLVIWDFRDVCETPKRLAFYRHPSFHSHQLRPPFSSHNLNEEHRRYKPTIRLIGYVRQVLDSRQVRRRWKDSIFIVLGIEHPHVLFRQSDLHSSLEKSISTLFCYSLNAMVFILIRVLPHDSLYQISCWEGWLR